MQRLAFAALAAGLFLALAHAAGPAPAPASARMDQAASHYYDARQFMGMVLVARGDQILFEKGYGSANLEWNVPFTPDTKFRIGSVTKQFTAAAILLLEERGKLKLDDPVKKLYPAAPKAWDAITVRHLLTHTSGIPNFTSFPDYLKSEPLPTTPEDTIKRFRDKPLEFAPGAEMRYSNSGYVLLGALIEKAGGVSYARFLEDNIFKPLGLKDTGYDWSRKLTPKRAAGYELFMGTVNNAGFVDMGIPYAAGALYSTVRDLHRWNQALYGNKLLSAASLKKMLTPPQGHYALGIVVGGNNKLRVYEHGGAITGFSSKLSWYPDTKTTVVTLSNLNGPGADAIAVHLGRLAHGQAVTLPNERKSVKVPVSTLQKYVGTYRTKPGFDMWFRVQGDRLISQATGQPQFPLLAESEITFYPEAFEAKMTFQFDAKGKVSGVILVQNGDTVPAPRVSDKPPGN